MTGRPRALEQGAKRSAPGRGRGKRHRSDQEISLWQIAVLVERGAVQVAGSLDGRPDDIQGYRRRMILPITPAIAAESTRLGVDLPKDPAGRIIVPTARCHGLRLVTADEHIRRRGKVLLA